MNIFTNKHIIILLLSSCVFFSCKSKKTFNGTSSLPCPEHDGGISEEKEKDPSKWKVVLYKDGEAAAGGKKTKKGKSRLFKKKNMQ